MRKGVHDGTSATQPVQRGVQSRSGEAGAILDGSAVESRPRPGGGAETLRLWVEAARPPSEVPLTANERGELKRLRREVRELRMERDILKKATAFFAKQSE